jgi:hypothetical protein
MSDAPLDLGLMSEHSGSFVSDVAAINRLPGEIAVFELLRGKTISSGGGRKSQMDANGTSGKTG